MRRTILSGLVLAVAVSTAGTVAHADVTGRSIQSANMQPEPGRPLESGEAKGVFCDLTHTGFNRVTLDIPLFQAGPKATIVTARAAGPGTSPTPTDAQLVTAIRNARQCGLKVVLKPHLELPGGEWRAHVEGSAAWQRSWDAWLVRYAKIGQAEHVDTIVVGTEQKDASLGKKNGARWVRSVAKVRKVFHGKVTYAAHTNDELLLLDRKFVSKLDYVSATWYPRPPKGTLTVATLEADMRADRKRYFDKAYKRYGHKHLVLAETGFRSVKVRDYYKKRSELDAGSVDLDLQRMQYEAMLRFVDTVPYIDGVMLYRAENVSGAGGTRDPWFTWQNKPAEQVIERWFTR